jgi:hypothetical protein
VTIKAANGFKTKLNLTQIYRKQTDDPPQPLQQIFPVSQTKLLVTYNQASHNF